MGATAHGRLTVEEFEALPEPEGERWELIDGEVVVSPAPAWGHGAVVARLAAALVPWAREHGAEVADAPGQPAGRDSELVPDLALVLADHTHRIGSIRLHGPADLVVEVSSPSNRHRDLGRKREVYEQIGVTEYWFVDREQRRVLVHRLAADRGYGEPVVVEVDETLTSPLLPGFAVAVDEVLGDGGSDGASSG